MNDHTDPMLDQPSTAEYLDVSERTLEDWRQKKRGPAYVRIGRLIRYRQSDLDAWLKVRTVRCDAA